MKTFSRITLGALFFAMSLMTACKKNEETVIKPSTSDMAQRLYLQKDFIDFAGSFAKNFKYLADYYQTPAVLHDKQNFIESVKLAGDNIELLESTHSKYGLSLDEINTRKILLDNNILQLYNAQPALLNYSGEEFWSIIKQSITLLKRSQSSNLIQSNDSGIKNMAITIDEVWDCLKDAVGIGAGSMLGIAGLHALAQKKGIQQVVVKFAALMARNMGYIGLAITVFDFSSCMYKESHD